MYKIIGSDQKQYGPVSADDLRQWMAQGRVNAQTLIQGEGQTDWRPLHSFPEFSPSASAPAPGPAPFPASSPALAGQSNSMAIASLVMGVVSLPLACCCYGFPFNVLAIVFGCIALSQLKNVPDAGSNRVMAKAGIIMGVLQFILIAVVVALGVAVNLKDIIQRFKG